MGQAMIFFKNIENILWFKFVINGHGGVLVVGVLAFHSNKQSSNPTEVYCFFSVKFVV